MKAECDVYRSWLLCPGMLSKRISYTVLVQKLFDLILVIARIYPCVITARQGRIKKLSTRPSVDPSSLMFGVFGVEPGSCRSSQHLL